MRLTCLILIIISVIILSGCNGERERVIIKEAPVIIQKEPVRTANYIIPEHRAEQTREDIPITISEEDVFSATTIRNVRENLDHGNGYILSGHFSLNSFMEEERDCVGKVLRKEFKKYRLYIFKDCNGNQAELITEK